MDAQKVPHEILVMQVSPLPPLCRARPKPRPPDASSGAHPLPACSAPARPPKALPRPATSLHSAPPPTGASRPRSVKLPSLAFVSGHLLADSCCCAVPPQPSRTTVHLYHSGQFTPGRPEWRRWKGELGF